MRLLTTLAVVMLMVTGASASEYLAFDGLVHQRFSPSDPAWLTEDHAVICTEPGIPQLDRRAVGGPLSSIGQSMCADGVKNQVQAGPLGCECSACTPFNGDPEDLRYICRQCPGVHSVYSVPDDWEFCADRGGVQDAAWYVRRLVQEWGLWRGDNSPFSVETQPGPDQATCRCIGSIETACIDTSQPAVITGREPRDKDWCHDVCGWNLGSFMKAALITTELDHPACLDAPLDRGPECHCYGPDGEVQPGRTCMPRHYANDDVARQAACMDFCESMGGEARIHHHLPTSTVCEGITEDEICSTRPGTATAALEHLRAATVQSHGCVPALEASP